MADNKPPSSPDDDLPLVDWGDAVDDWDAAVGDLATVSESSRLDVGAGSFQAPLSNPAPSSLPNAGSLPVTSASAGDSEAVVIPNLAELSAAALEVRSLVPLVAAVVAAPPDETNDATEPLAPLLVNAEEILLVQEDPSHGEGADPFDGAALGPETVALFPPPENETGRVHAFVENIQWDTVRAPVDGPTLGYKEERMALLADELEALQLRDVAPHRLAWVALEAARAAHMAGSFHLVTRLIDRACAAAPDAVAPRRERLRLFDRGALTGVALAERLSELVTDVSERAGVQREAYASLGRALRGSAGQVRRLGAVDPLDPGAALLVAALHLRSDDHPRAAEALGAAGLALAGPTGAQFLETGARLLELHAAGDRGVSAREQARALAPDALGGLLSMLRAASLFSTRDALAALQAVVNMVPDETLKGAIGRWASSLAESQGDLILAADLLGVIVDGKPLVELRVAERITLLPLHINDVIENPEGWVEGLPPEECALLFSAAAELALRLPREAEAFELLDRALALAPQALFAAMLVERLGHTLADSGVRRRSLSLWAKSDPARSGSALLELCAELSGAGDGPELVAAQNAAAGALPRDAAFLSFAWHELSQRRYVSAAQRFDRGADAFLALGEPSLASALRERAEDARVADVPMRAVVRAMARSSTVEESLDHPRILALMPIEQGRTPSVVAAAFRGAAMGSRQMSLRVLEAASWLKAAGQRKEAIQFLHPRWGTGEPSRALGLLLRVLTNTFDESDTAAIVFERLATTAQPEDQRSLWQFRRAEALAGAGRFAEAAAAWSAVGAGPLQVESILAYRRALASAGDWASLDGLLRDEADGYQGVGRLEQASGVLVERAQVRAEALGDPEGSLALMQEALSLAPKQTGLAIRAFVMASVQKNLAGVRSALLALGQGGDADGAFLSLLLAESQQRPSDVSTWLAHLGANDPHRLALLARRFEPTLVASDWRQLASVMLNRVDGDPRLLSQLQLREAETLARDGGLKESLSLIEQLLLRDPSDFAALRLQARVAKAAGKTETSVGSLVSAALLCNVAQHSAQLYLEAVAVAGASDARIEDWLRRALSAEPGNESAFAQLRGRLEAREDFAGLAEIIQLRQGSPVPKEELELLRLERAALLVRAGDKTGAKTELRALLLSDPQNPKALRDLVELEYQDGAYSIAADMYLRLARVETVPQNQLQIFRRLGRIYHRRLSDPKLAAGAFERVLKLDPNDLDGLTGLSEIYTKQNDVPRAIAASERAVALEPDEKRRLSFQLRLAALYEKQGDVRVAGNLLRRAYEQSPRSLQAIGELARYLERHKDTQGRRVLLDTSLSRLHDDLRRFPGDLSALRTIVPVLRWCSRAAGSAASAQLLCALSDDPLERRELQSWLAAPPTGRRLTPLVNPEVDELAYPSRLPPGIRQVMRVLGPPLAKASRPDLRRYGVTRAERIGVGEGPRAIVDALAVDLGVRGFEVFVTDDKPDALLVEPGDPPAIVLGSALVKRGPVALRFAAGFALRLVATHFDLLTARDPGPEALLSALVRQFLNVTTEVSPMDEAAVQQVLPRLTKALGRSQRAELRPFVAEMASPESLANVATGVLETAARVGLLASGDLAVSIEVFLAAQGQILSPANLANSPVASGLFEFALSADYELLFRAIDSVS